MFSRTVEDLINPILQIESAVIDCTESNKTEYSESSIKVLRKHLALVRQNRTEV